MFDVWFVWQYFWFYDFILSNFLHCYCRDSNELTYFSVALGFCVSYKSLFSTLYSCFPVWVLIWQADLHVGLV